MDLDDLLKSIREEKDEEIPEGLDDLLSSIRGGDKKTVDIKKVIGDEKVEKYRMELVAEGKIPGTKENASPEEIKEGFKLYRKDKQEFKTFVEKVLQKKAAAGGGDGGMRLPPGNIPTPGPSAKPTQLLLPGTADTKQEQQEQEKKKRKARIKKDPLLEKLDAILKSTTSIEKLMARDLKLDKEIAERERKRLERERGEKKEKFREQFKKMIGAPVKKLLAPVKNLFDMIVDAITKIFLGAALMRLLDWLGDRENQRKLGNIFKFLSKFWPAFLALYLAFGNGFSRAILGMTGKLIMLIPRLLKAAAGLAKAAFTMLKNAPPWAKVALAGTALFTAGAVIPKLMPGTVDKQERKTEAAPGSKEEKIEKLKQQKKNLNPLQLMQGVGSEIDEQIYKLETGKTKAYSGGGFVSNSSFNSKNVGKNFAPKNDSITFSGFSGGGVAQGTDTVPAMLTPGEFVMSRGAVSKFGVGTLEAMNAAGGGTNRPRLLGGMTYAQGGGQVNRRGRKTSNATKPTGNTSNEKDTDKGTKTKLEGTGGGPAVISAGKQILQKGFTVAEHPNFRKNNWSRQGPNTGTGFNAGGGERVGGHSNGSAHYKGLAIDVTDWRSGDWLGRTSALAESIYKNRAALKVTQIIHDPWGSWFAGESGKGGAIGGHGTHLHLAFAGGPGSGSIGDPASTGAGGGSYAGGGGSGGDGGSGAGGGGGGFVADPNFNMGPGSAAADTSYLDPGRFMPGANFLSAGNLSTDKNSFLNQVSRREQQRGSQNAAYLNGTSPSDLTQKSGGIVDLSSGGTNATTQASAPTRGTTQRGVSPEDELNMSIYGIRALHNIIF